MVECGWYTGDRWFVHGEKERIFEKKTAADDR